MITVTFDTNCINAKHEIQALIQLEEWHRGGLIQIIYSTSVEEELLDNKGAWGHKRREKISTYSPLDTAFWLWGYSRWGISTKWAGESTKEEMERMAGILFPNRRWSGLSSGQIRDVMTLHTHWTYKRDAFVTLNTKDFVGTSDGKRERLRNEFGILALTPEEAVDFVRPTSEI